MRNEEKYPKDFMGFGSHETAWAWLHKLRKAMVRPSREKLEGEVEVDETYIGGEEKGKSKQGRGAKTKILVVVATECNGKQIGRVRRQFLRIVLPGGFIERDLNLNFFLQPYHIINMKDLLTLYQQVPFNWLRPYINKQVVIYLIIMHQNLCEEIYDSSFLSEGIQNLFSC